MNVFNFRIQVFVSVSEWLQPSPGLETPAPAGQGWEPSGDGASLGTGAGAGIL